MAFDLVTITTTPQVVPPGSGFYQNLGDGRGYIPMDLWIHESYSTIADGTFEAYPVTGGVPRNWTGFTGLPLTEGASYAIVQDGVSGSKAAQLSVGSGSVRNARMAETVATNCTPGQVVRLSVQAKTSDATAGGIRFDIFARSSTGESSTYTTPQFALTSTYQTFSYNWTVPAGIVNYRPGVSYGSMGTQIAVGSTMTIDNFTKSIVTAENKPGAPENVTYTQTATTATLYWTPPTTTGGSAITGYIAARDGTDASGGGAWFTDPPLASTQRSITFLSLVPGQTYNLSVAAVNVNGQGFAVVKTVTMAA